jgi:phage protein U
MAVTDFPYTAAYATSELQVNNQIAGRRTVGYVASGTGENILLYSWGPLQFTVWPLNIHQAQHQTASDWAKKEIVGAAIYREWVGEGDEQISVRGRLFPYRIGGLRNLEALETMRREGITALLVRGDGAILGWYICEKLARQHSFLGPEGVGKQLDFEALFTRAPAPDPSEQYPVLWRSVL